MFVFGLRAVVSAALLGICVPACASSISVSFTGHDNVGQRLAYSLKEAINSSTMHKLVYNDSDAGFVIILVTVENDENASTAYAATLTIPPWDGKGYSYYITQIAGTCGSARIQECAQGILASFDEPISVIVAVLSKRN